MTEDARKYTQGDKLFEAFYGCVIESQPNVEFDRLIRIGFDVARIPYRLLKWDKNFVSNLIINEYLCEKIIDSHCTEPIFVVWIGKSKNKKLIDLLLKTPQTLITITYCERILDRLANTN